MAARHISVASPVSQWLGKDLQQDPLVILVNEDAVLLTGCYLLSSHVATL
jgi:hypothetical protein